MDGCDGWREIKSVLQFSSYFVRIYSMYICTYIDCKKLKPTFRWVSKFDVQLGVGEHHFQNYPMCESFQIFSSKLVFFLFVLIGFIRVFVNLKNLFCCEKVRKLAPTVFTNGMDRWDGRSKMSFYILHTMQASRTCIYILGYILNS